MLDAAVIFINAEVYYATSKILTQHSMQNRPQFAPAAVVCEAFCLELYFKALITLESSNTPHGHDLAKLFRAVSPANQAKIHSNFDQRTGKLRQAIEKASGLQIDLAATLKVSRNAFKHMRYFYEGGSPSEGWAAGPVIECIRSVILGLRPEWANLPNGALPTFPVRQTKEPT